MAGIDVGGGEKRPKNSDINMIPFIDLLMVTIAFLLITAVWVTNSRLKTNAEVPSLAGCGENCAKKTDATMHVHVEQDGFRLVWKRAATVLNEVKVPKQELVLNAGGSSALKYPDLSEAIQKESKRSGDYQETGKEGPIVAVLHSDNKTPFRELVAVLDAISGPQREVRLTDGRAALLPTFSTTFASQ